MTVTLCQVGNLDNQIRLILAILNLHVALMPHIKFLNSSVRLKIQEVMLMQSGGCCAQDTSRGTFALSSIL